MAAVMASTSASVEARGWRSSDEGPLGEQVLAPGREAEAEGEEADADEDPLPLGLAAHPVETAVGGETGQAEEQEERPPRISARRGFLA